MEISLYPRYFLRSLFVHSKRGFFKAGYRLMYPECTMHGMSPWQHYVLEGSRKGYDLGNNPPGDLFFREGYEAEYPDVKEAGYDPWRHYAENGLREGRDNGLHPASEFFFAEGYLVMYPDAAKSGMDAWHHFVLIGLKEGRNNGNNPQPEVFFPEGYELEYPEVKDEGTDPWRDYVEKGRSEGRDNGLNPKTELFSADCYLEMYPDAAESGMDAWHHYVLIGMKEGRDNGNHQAVDGRKSISWPDAGHFYSKNILIIAELSIPQCKLYRVDQKAIALERQGYNVKVSRWTDRSGSISQMQDCSVVIFYRVPWREDVIACFKEAKRLGIHTVFDIDDLVFDTDVFGQVLKNTLKSDAEKADLVDGVRLYCDAMLQADENWFSTKTLCDLSDDAYGTHGVCVPNCIPEELASVAEEFSGEKKDGRIVTIFYGAGSSTHDMDIAEVSDVLEQLLMRNDNVRLTLIGDIKFGFRNAELKRKIARVERIGLKDYYYLISQSDIAVIPLEQNLFNTAKSNIKYLEASLFRVPSVCSDLYEFSSVIKNGDNGFIAKSREEWAKYLQLLIDSKAQRDAVGESAYRTVMALYSPDELSRKLASLVGPYTVSRNSSKKDSVLIVNVRFGVSSKDGTAAIVESLADEIKNESGLEVHVFSTYSDLHDMFGTVRRYAWHGMNVWAVNVATVNWGYSDEGIRGIFAKVIDLLNPKLVYFHSIQTLGMDMCLECIERKIPYFVTMHDGWWICARKFLVDARGRWCGEKSPTGEMCRAKCGISNSDFFRRRHLAQYILRKAEKVYTPTDYFSDFLRRSFPTIDIKTLRNGIPEIDREAARSKENSLNESSKIVLGFFGGRNESSGYFLLKECLESLGSEKNNFRLVFALSSLEEGSEGRIINDGWPVETEIEKYSDVRGIPDALGKLDVLLYPRMRKECFGLIVREAIKSSVFVVCSSCGGPAEAVVNNENGLLLPVGDMGRLRECLLWLIKRKDFIRGYRPQNFGDIRTFKEQADELLRDFDSVKPACNLPDAAGDSV